jgi:hypothetical protein
LSTPTGPFSGTRNNPTLAISAQSPLAQAKRNLARAHAAYDRADLLAAERKRKLGNKVEDARELLREAAEAEALKADDLSEKTRESIAAILRGSL